MHHHMDVFMGLGVIANILTSCIEVYPKETIGLLGGYRTSKRNRLVMAYPLQKVSRKKNAVTIMDRKSYRRTLRIMEPMGIEFYGFYHSHPDFVAQPSEHDILSSVEEILSLNREHKMLEIIIGIKRKKYKRKQRSDFMLRELSTKGGRVFDGYLIEPRNRFDFQIVGEWVEISQLYYEVAPNRYKVNLSILERDVRRAWTVEKF